MTTAGVHVLGVRHHGPGSARSVVAALERLRPQAVLVEGPADADPLLERVGDPVVVPPVAVPDHAVDDPGRAAFWPFAEFSPEWQAVRWARAAGVPVRFCDLPAAVTLAPSGTRRSLAAPPADERRGDVPDDAPGGGPDGGPDGGLGARPDGGPDAGPDGGAPDGGATAPRADPAGTRPVDPLDELAAAAGYDDAERWWDAVVEGREHATAPFEELTAAMTVLREGHGLSLREARREAHMRRVLRQTITGGASSVACVVGAWHAPALTGRLPTAAADTKLLTRLPRRKVALTWVPWTHSRLGVWSGYGAGITSPGWYEHLFAGTGDPLAGWFTRVAGVLREEDLPVSTASVIEAVRSARTLAALRGRAAAGLAEVQDVTRAVLVDGDEGLLGLVTDRLVVGERLGAVPDDVATTPLEADLRATARRLRLPVAAAPKTLDLDLREPTGAERSRFLRRLLLLDLPWGRPGRDEVRSTGTFRETWTLEWDPTLSVRLVEASLWGTTVASAATARMVSRAEGTGSSLVDLAEGVETCLLADLPDALPAVLTALDERAGHAGDAGHLMDALSPVVRSLRYGDVRGTRTPALGRVADALLARVCAVLPVAVQGVDDDAAGALRTRLEAVHRAVSLRDDPDATRLWSATLHGLVERADLHGLLLGRLVRLLHDAGDLPGDDVATRLSRALSVGVPAPAKAAWVEGFLAGGGLLLVHDRQLLAALDGWLVGLGPRDLVDALPALRRAFGAVAAGERRAVASAVVSLGGGPRAAAADDGPDVDWEQADAALRAVAALLAGAR
ncbi:DUF5682 family protein [Aquipuribacter hungaricus]|uniref:DUF5682 family protein n=1 Tax=Aquipuribacter hungaricus TaxID=545624 RepID=UPI003611CC92